VWENLAHTLQIICKRIPFELLTTGTTGSRRQVTTNKQQATTTTTTGGNQRQTNNKITRQEFLTKDGRKIGKGSGRE